MKLVIIVALACSACVDKLDPQWQLDYDHVIAVRATPPRVPAGGTATLDALVAHAGGEVTIDVPAQAIVMAPSEMAAALAYDGAWRVTAPETATLRAPIPLQLGMAFVRPAGTPLEVTKTVLLGPTGDNPAMPEVVIDGTPARGELHVTADQDVALTVAADPGWRVNWLSSCGTLHDDDQAAAVLHVGKTDPQAGQLAVVVRDPDGGVAWRVFAIAAE